MHRNAASALEKLSRMLAEIAQAIAQLKLDTAKLDARVAAIDKKVAAIGRRLNGEGDRSGGEGEGRDFDLERAIFGEPRARRAASRMKATPGEQPRKVAARKAKRQIEQPAAPVANWALAIAQASRHVP
jgi:hypothetical protein